MAVLNSGVAGAVAGIAALGLEVDTGASLALGAVAFLSSLAAFIVLGIRTIGAYRRNMVVRFPTPSADTV